MIWDRKLARWAMLGMSIWLYGCADTRGTVHKTAPPVPTPPEAAPALYIPAPPQASNPDPATPSPGATQALDPKVMSLPALVPVAAATQPELTPAAVPASAPESKLGDLYRRAAKQAASMNSYIMRLRRREVVQGRKRPEEIMLVKFRREPFSVYLKWLGNEAKNREVIYVKGRYDSLIHTKVAAGDVILMPAGKRFSLPADSFLAKSNSRHSITHAGLENLVNQFGQLVTAAEKGDAHLGTVTYLGVLKRPEFETTVEGVRQTLQPGNEALLPRGGQRLWFFDTKQNLPVLVITHDENRQEVEYYCHDRIEFPVGLDDADFNPDVLWGKQ